MLTTRLYTADDLAALGPDAPYELIDGELRPVSPCFGEASHIAVQISTPLHVHVRAHRLGIVFGADGGFDLTAGRGRKTIVAPDVGFVRRERIPRGYDFRSYFPGPPDLAVEVMSISDAPMEVAEKVQRFLQAGAIIVWEVRPLVRTILVHRHGREPIVLGDGDVLDGEEVVPGFRLPVREVFDDPVIDVIGGDR